MSLASGTRLALRPFDLDWLRVVPSLVEGRWTQGDLEHSRKVGPYEVIAPLGACGPPSLTAACGRSFGAAAVAMERTCR